MGRSTRLHNGACVSFGEQPIRLVEHFEERASAPLTADRKVELFRSLFRGRDDVFAVRWESRKGRAGYSPQCANEWRPGVCEKPRVRCAACPNQAFAPADHRAVRDHLQGRIVMGLYPLLNDDTCHLLAIDLDGESWPADVGALRDACTEVGLTPAVERSRSGAGAHVWLFFSEAVAAADARSLGSMLLTRAMARSSTLAMNSYDRLFPSQDTLPAGGFGNLIALPLQRAARDRGNTEFLDDGLDPHPDQWDYLASVPRLSGRQVRELIAGERGTDALAVIDPAREKRRPWRTGAAAERPADRGRRPTSDARHRRRPTVHRARPATAGARGCLTPSGGVRESSVRRA